jgi:glycosyltransferase involved in cell wall biosynthesis
MRIGMVTTYPNISRIHENMGGVASYTKNLIDGILENNKENILIFANKLDTIEQTTNEKNPNIIRCWDEGKKASFQILFETLRKRNEYDLLHFQYEFFLYGGFLFSLFYPFMLFIYTLCRIPVITTIHQVPPIKNIGREFLKKNDITGNQLLFRIALFVLIKLIVSFSKRIIIHENYFKKLLIYQYKCEAENIHIIPHGIEKQVNNIDQQKAKEALNLLDKKILLFFGYLSGYKGIDLLIDSFPSKNEDFNLIIAGGKHPRLKNKPSYLQYLKNLKIKARKISDNIQFTGFLNEKDIPLYFSAADLVIFPYLSHFSSSGPLSLSIAYEKPFIVSEVFDDQIDEKELIFDLNQKSLSKKINQFFLEEQIQKKAIHFSKALKNEYLWSNIGKKTIQIYHDIS